MKQGGFIATALLTACFPIGGETQLFDTDASANNEDPKILRGLVAFGFPLPERERFLAPTVHVDHDAVIQPDTALGRTQCTNYQGERFPHCYDEHDGSDYPLHGGFRTMDNGSTPIVAALSGTVIEIDDGNYDRCHADLGLGDISCDGHPMRANFVKIDHGRAVESWYWHIMKGSVAVSVGQEVECGDLLGRVGSSGYSSTPHLHFEVRVNGQPVDPYAGTHSQTETWWEQQHSDDAHPAAGCAKAVDFDSDPNGG